MASLPSLPEELKFINPYLQRGQETRKKEPVISYYCKIFNAFPKYLYSPELTFLLPLGNYYAAKLALEKGTKSKDSKVFLNKLLDILEQVSIRHF